MKVNELFESETDDDDEFAKHNDITDIQRLISQHQRTTAAIDRKVKRVGYDIQNTSPSGNGMLHPLPWRAGKSLHPKDHKQQHNSVGMSLAKIEKITDQLLSYSHDQLKAMDDYDVERLSNWAYDTLLRLQYSLIELECMYPKCVRRMDLSNGNYSGKFSPEDDTYTDSFGKNWFPEAWTDDTTAFYVKSDFYSADTYPSKTDIEAVWATCSLYTKVKALHDMLEVPLK